MRPAFDLLAGYGPSGSFMERSGLGVACAGRATAAFSMSLDGREAGGRRATLRELLGGYEHADDDPDAPPPLLFGSVPFDVDRSGTFFVPNRTVRRDREGETWAIDVAWDGAFRLSRPLNPWAREHRAPHSPVCNVKRDRPEQQRRRCIWIVVGMFVTTEQLPQCGAAAACLPPVHRHRERGRRSPGAGDAQTGALHEGPR